MIKVIKRDGTEQDYDFSKIVNAVTAAFNATRPTTKSLNQSWIDYIVILIRDKIAGRKVLSVEEIQDIVENCLMEAGTYDVAKSYILYREKHTEERLLRGRIQYMKDYQVNGENAATSSASDPNANMNIKNVANMESEVYKLDNRKIQRVMLYDSIEKLYGKELADQYIKDLTSHIIYSHDEASTPVIKNYCEAVTLYPLLEGTGSLDGTSTKAPEHLDSFCGQLVNTTFLLASQCKGAVAFGEFFNFFDYFAVKDYGENYDLIEDKLVDNPEVIKDPKTIGQKIEQQFQHVVFN